MIRSRHLISDINYTANPLLWTHYPRIYNLTKINLGLAKCSESLPCDPFTDLILGYFIEPIVLLPRCEWSNPELWLKLATHQCMNQVPNHKYTISNVVLYAAELWYFFLLARTSCELNSRVVAYLKCLDAHVSSLQWCISVIDKNSNRAREKRRMQAQLHIDWPLSANWHLIDIDKRFMQSICVSLFQVTMTYALYSPNMFV